MKRMDERYGEGDQVRSERFGIGQVEFDKGLTVIVRFDHGLEGCEKSTLTPIATPMQAVAQARWGVPLQVVARIQAEAIQSVNDTWGVFSRSRIALLPHQLWVCRRVLAEWPARWLIADDVGLGKTIEAGLILWPLLARGTVKRLLVLCPASLVAQWQHRLYTMFDIRLQIYTSEADTPRSNFWALNDQVVASLQTLRADHRGRQQRMLEGPPWDLLIVDEAHHLHASEEEGPTLGYKLVERLVQGEQVGSMVFFTGTPHRGKNFAVLALLQLLKPDLFDPKQPLSPQLAQLNGIMIRNNKQNVTDLQGRRLFQEPLVSSETYHFSAAEERFYAMLTEFIVSGKAYASSLSGSGGRIVILVLIAMQKLASSSVAAISRAIEGRLARLGEARARLGERAAPGEGVDALLRRFQETAEWEDEDQANSLAEQAVIDSASLLKLMGDEEARLGELLEAARQVREETKITKILALLATRFAERPVLLFTEYKATQSLLISALLRRFGTGCVAFINGDNVAEGIDDGNGTLRTLRETREEAAARFNEGQVRFLVSTEAGGEGIDLQERCHSLIHVDLPWNPMRLHQRVGRLNRYGQRHRVEVISLRNPDTVESRIWDKLNEKIARIMEAFGPVMDQPEDLLQLVLGMTSPSFFTDVFAEAPGVRGESLSTWFDTRTAQFGGQDVLRTVRELVGNSARFDFQQVSVELPQVDLPDLRPFLIASLALNRKRVSEEDGMISFATPEGWRVDARIRTHYAGLLFDRESRVPGARERMVGVGHAVVGAALRQALAEEASVAALPESTLSHPLFLFRITDQVTGRGSTVRAVVVGVSGERPDRVLRDWEVLQRLNGLVLTSGQRRRLRDVAQAGSGDDVRVAAAGAQRVVEAELSRLSLTFAVPGVDLLAVLWPIPTGMGSEWDDRDDEE